MSKLILHPFLIFLAQIVNSHLVEEIQYLKVENRILRSKLGKRVVTTKEEKAQLLRFGVPLGDRLKDLITIVTYETFRNWARGKFYKGNGKVGRPGLMDDIKALVILMARENPSWGYPKIKDELKKLGIKIGRTSIQNILKKEGLEPAPLRRDSKWTEFIKTHMDTLIACDFFTKEIWTLKGRITIYVFFFIEIGTRRVHLAGITRYPNQRWVELRTREVLDKMEDGGFHPRYMIRDRDGKFSEDYDKQMKDAGIEVVKTPVKNPSCNVYAERWVWSIKHECLNYFMVFGEEHLKYLVESYLDYYNRFRPHQGIGNVTIEPLPPAPPDGEIESVSILGGLHHHYRRKAA